MAIIDFGGTKEKVITRKEFSMARARKVLKNETIAIIGYGVQGPAQGLNLRDNGFKVIVGQAKAFTRDWDRAVKGRAAQHDHPDARVGRGPTPDLAERQKESQGG
jgi:ketol-acid reductoisomerase